MTDAAAALDAARREQAAWADRTLRDRLGAIRRLRRLIIRDAQALALAAGRSNASQADIQVAEVMPLAAACRYLERHARRVLAETHVGWWRRPPWLWGTRLRIARQPFGTILVIGPGNYPLFLPGVQALQALTAGNAVLLKPAPGGAACLHHLHRLLVESGIPAALCPVLGDDVATGRAALQAGPDKVILTGSVETGRAVSTALADRLIPSVMELSGNDPFIVLRGADLAAAACALAYGLSLNGGATCIAPRRIICARDVADALVERLRPALAAMPARLIGTDVATWLTQCHAAIGMMPDQAGRAGPIVLRAPDATPRATPFAGVAWLHVVDDEAAAIACANAGDRVLGACVFGPRHAAEATAAQLRAGCVVINDVIAPTADPHLPFGGGDTSGFGVTRGAEGLLACTRPRAVVARSRPTLRHMRVLDDAHATTAAAAVAVLYGGIGQKCGGLWRLIRRRPPSPPPGPPS